MWLLKSVYDVDAIFVGYVDCSRRIYQYFAFHSNVTELTHNTHTQSRAYGQTQPQPSLTSTANAPFFAALLPFGRFEFLSTFLLNFFLLFAFSAPSSLAAHQFHAVCIKYVSTFDSFAEKLHNGDDVPCRLRRTNAPIIFFSNFRLIVWIFSLIVCYFVRSQRFKCNVITVAQIFATRSTQFYVVKRPLYGPNDQLIFDERTKNRLGLDSLNASVAPVAHKFLMTLPFHSGRAQSCTNARQNTKQTATSATKINKPRQKFRFHVRMIWMCCLCLTVLPVSQSQMFASFRRIGAIRRRQLLPSRV